MYDIYFGLEAYYDEAKELGLDSYFSDRGLFVRPEYRNLGIEQELFKVRFVYLNYIIMSKPSIHYNQGFGTGSRRKLISLQILLLITQNHIQGLYLTASIHSILSLKS